MIWLDAITEADEPSLHSINGRLDHYAGGKPLDCGACAVVAILRRARETGLLNESADIMGTEVTRELVLRGWTLSRNAA